MGKVKTNFLEKTKQSADDVPQSAGKLSNWKNEDNIAKDPIVNNSGCPDNSDSFGGGENEDFEIVTANELQMPSSSSSSDANKDKDQEINSLKRQLKESDKEKNLLKAKLEEKKKEADLLEQKKSDDLENKLKVFVESMFTNLENQHIASNQKKFEELKKQVEKSLNRNEILIEKILIKKRKKKEKKIKKKNVPSEVKHIREVIILYHTEEEMNNDFMEAIIDEIKVDQANQDDENYRNILGGAKIQPKIFNPQSSDNLPIYDPSQHSGVVYIYVPNSAGVERVDKIPGLEENSNPANRDRFKEWQNQLFLLIPTGKVSLEKDWRSLLKTSTHSCYGVFDLKNIGHILYLKNKERANLYKGVFDPRTTLLIGKDSHKQTDDETINVNIGTKERLTDFFRGNAISLGVSEDSSTSSDSEFEDSESESESRERDPVPNTQRKKYFGFL